MPKDGCWGGEGGLGGGGASVINRIIDFIFSGLFFPRSNAIDESVDWFRVGVSFAVAHSVSANSAADRFLAGTCTLFGPLNITPSW